MDHRSFELAKEIDRRKRKRATAYWMIPFGVIVAVVAGYWIEPTFALLSLLIGSIFGPLGIRAYSARIAEVETEKTEWDQYVKPGDRA
ncbi:MAG: hypothetical protein AAFT19_02300 [Pseudomonadota bacterium]